MGLSMCMCVYVYVCVCVCVIWCNPIKKPEQVALERQCNVHTHISYWPELPTRKQRNIFRFFVLHV